MEFSQAPMLVGGMFPSPTYHSEGRPIEIEQIDTPKEIRRLEKHFKHDARAGKELAVLFRSSVHPLNRPSSSNFEKDRFLMLLDYFLEHRVIKTDVKSSFSIETSASESSSLGPLPREVVMSKKVRLIGGGGESASSSSAPLEEIEGSIYSVAPEGVIEASKSLGKVQSFYEYIPTIAYTVRQEEDEFEGERPSSSTVFAASFPYNDCWTVNAEARLEVSSRSVKDFFSGVVGALKPFEEAKVGETSLKPARLREIFGGFKASQYRLKLVYAADDKSGPVLFERMEDALSPILHSGRKRETKERTFKRGYNMAVVWSYYKPFLMAAAPAFGAKLEKEYTMNILYIARFFSPIRTGSKAALVRAYRDAGEVTHIATPKIDGTRTWLYAVLSAGTEGDSLRLTQAGGSLSEEKVWPVDAATSKKWRKILGASPTETLVSIYDTEESGGTHYVFDIIASGSKNCLLAPLSERWKEIRSTFSAALLTFLGSKGVKVRESWPVTITQANFKEEVIKMFEPTAHGLPCDGIIFSNAAAPYYPFGRAQLGGINVRFKPGENNTFDFLLKKVERETLVPYGIDPPKKGVVYLAYVGAVRSIISGIPRQEIRSKLWLSRDFPNYIRPSDPKVDMPVLFMTCILPTSHVVIGEDASYDDTIAECYYDTKSGFMRVHRRRDDKTTEYKSGAAHYGNKYEKAYELLPAVLDPITRDTVLHIEKETPDYYDVGLNLSRTYYKYFTGGCSVGKAILYGKYFKASLSAGTSGGSGAFGQSFQVNPGVIVELSAGRGSDLPRALLAGATQIFAVDPDITALVTLEAKARKAWLLYSPAASNVRKKIGYEDPIVHQPGSFPAAFNLRCTIGGFSSGTSAHKKILEDLYAVKFPSTGAPVLSNQFAVHYILDSQEGANNYKWFVDRVLRTGGVLGVTYYDGDAIAALFDREHPPTPWKKAGGSSVELLFTDSDRSGKRKYYIEKRWAKEASSPSSSFGRKIGILLPTISPNVLEEPLVSRKALEELFYMDYDILYSGRMIDMEEFRREMEANYGTKGKLQDALSGEDYAYLSLVNVFVASKKKKSTRAKVAFSSSSQ